MKKFAFLLLILISLNTYAIEGLKIPIYDYRWQGEMIRIDLESNEYIPRVELDCDGFRKHLNLYNDNGKVNYTITLSNSECLHLMDQLMIRINGGGRACLVLNTDKGREDYAVENFSSCEEN